MGIYLPNMEMPTRCGRCDMRIPAYDDGMFDHYECCITAAIIDNLGEKMEDCPLVPVPPHGRCIDADALLEDVRQSASEQDAENLNDWWVGEMPTIIPAEEKQL